MPRRGRLVFLHDLVMAALSFVLAMLLRVGGDVFQFFDPRTLVLATLVFTVIAGAMFLITDLYRGVWRYASASDMIAVTRAATLTILVFLLVMFTWTRLEPLPRSVPFINWLVLIALLAGPRFFYRLTKDRRMDRRLEAEAGRKVPVLLAGSGSEAELFIRGLRAEQQRVYTIVGIVAEKAKRVGQQIHGVPILGTLADLPSVVATLKARGQPVERVILTKERADGAAVRRLFDDATALGLTLARLPRLTDFRSGAPGTTPAAGAAAGVAAAASGAEPAAFDPLADIRPIAIEDLLGRPQMPLDRDAMRAMIAGRRVAVTGAGGSIGSELVRQVAGFAPAKLVLIEQSEFNLYTIEAEVRARHAGLPCPAVLADVRDRRRIMRLFEGCRPEVVFHAAALKHVPLVELNPFEGVATNVGGTVNCADAAVAAGAGAVVVISTDKAINPTSVMGASKRIAERYCQALDLQGAATGGTRFVTVRFGNVLGSTGSVVPLFQRQIAAGGPVTVTHPEMRRYFMTTREAVELVLQAAALGRGDGAFGGKVFVLDMGEPVRILDLARQMIRLSGLRPDTDIRIDFIGLRPGEKLFEELFHAGEDTVPTDVDGILLAAPMAGDVAALAPDLAALAAACAAADATALDRGIRRLVPEFRSDATLPAAATA